MKSNDLKQYVSIAAVIAGAFAVYKISTGVSKGISDVGSGLGSGLNSLLGGAGAGVANAGAGVEFLGYGAGQGISYTGQGIYELGAGVGGGLFQVGSGIQQIGAGAGYAVSGANIQDIVQTILTLGKGEASTYNSGLKLSQETAANQGQDSGASTFAKTQTPTEETTAPTAAPTAAKSAGSQTQSILSIGGTPAIVQLAQVATSSAGTAIKTAVQNLTPSQKQAMVVAGPIAAISPSWVTNSINNSPIGLLTRWISGGFKR